MFSIVIPTLQKDTKILKMLLDELNQDQTVGEIILIDNSLQGFKYNSDKLRIIIPNENLFVNPSWNLGVEKAKFDYVGILNDDILLPKNLVSDVFSFIKYVVSPDTMVDKEQGVGKIIARTLTMLAILIILPTIFFKSDIFPGQNAPILTMLQNGVIKTLPKVILGISDDNGNTTTTAKENGNVMALNMLSSLYYPNE